MNTKAKLYFKGEERELLNSSVSYECYTYSNGKPKTDPLDGTITVSFASQMYDDIFIESLIENRLGKDVRKVEQDYQKLYKPHDGKIVFYKDDSFDIELFQYNFKDAVIIDLYEEFDSQHGMYVTMVISPAMQDYRFFKGSTSWDKVSPTSYIKHAWEESWVPPRKDTKVVAGEKDYKPRLEKWCLADKDFKEIEKADNEDWVYLVVETKNLKGQQMTIDLHNPNVDFLIDGDKEKRLKNDVLKDYTIRDDKEIIKLKVVKQLKEESNGRE